MPCIFCIAAVAMVAGALSAAAIDRIEDGLASKAESAPRRVADTESMAKYEFDTRVGRKRVPVAVTVYKEHGRVRVQILSHDLAPEDAERLLREICEAIGAEIVSRSQPEDEHQVQDAVDDHEAEDREADAEDPAPEPEREPEPERRQERNAPNA